MSPVAAPLPSFPDATGTFLLPGPAGALEIAVELPIAADARRGVAVLCHPNPPDGGTMHNKVVTIMARALAELGVAAVRFNFRGVGQSEGEFDNGRGEILDLLAVARWAQAARPEDALWLGGFSFGSWVALQAARQLPVQQMISVAPPVGMRDFTGVLPPACPWLLIQGEKDEVVDAAGVFAWAAKLDPAPTIVRMPDTGHFFHRRLLDLRGAIKNGVRRNLPPPLLAP
jgi:alpha/beta superfamily hydrolase